MKKIVALILSICVAMVSLQGCYGKMALTRKVYQVNGEVKDRYLRSLVSWVFILVPIYFVSAVADFILFNTIEFWSGNNPVAEGEKNFQYAANGENFHVTARKSGKRVYYVINHYRGNNYLDTLSIIWDLKTGNSTATLTGSGKVTEFDAVREEVGVKVNQYANKPLNGVPELVAFYR